MKQQYVTSISNLLKACPQIEFIRTSMHGSGRSPNFYLNKLWALNLYSYPAEVTLNGETHIIKNGYICLMPPETSREFLFKERSLHRVAHFFISGSEVYKNSAPILLDAGEKFDNLLSRFDKALKYHTANPARCRAVFWDLLWDISELPGVNNNYVPQPSHPELVHAVNIIEKNFTEHIKVKDIAAAVDLSHNQLNRLFNKHYDCSIQGYIRKRRAQMAKHLLQGTNIRIKEIAYEVGISNLQQFNKFIREYYGLSPRALRDTDSV